MSFKSVKRFLDPGGLLPGNSDDKPSVVVVNQGAAPVAKDTAVDPKAAEEERARQARVAAAGGTTSMFNAIGGSSSGSGARKSLYAS